MITATKPLIIEVVQEDHTHTATVYDLKQLERYCRTIADNGKTFRWGSIFDYGTHDIQAIVNQLRSIQLWSFYDRRLPRA